MDNPIPSWNATGLLPMIHPVTQSQSPYKVTSEQLVIAMGMTSERRRLLQGWLDLRRELYGIGLTDGWQWVDGSFVENIEFSENRPPNDVDVVTFVRFPKGNAAGVTQRHRRLFITQHARAEFGVDMYYVDIENLPFSEQVKRTRYWRNWWSCTRNNEKKGFLTVRLSSHDDLKAMEILSLMEMK